MTDDKCPICSSKLSELSPFATSRCDQFCRTCKLPVSRDNRHFPNGIPANLKLDAETLRVAIDACAAETGKRYEEHGDPHPHYSHDHAWHNQGCENCMGALEQMLEEATQ